MYKLPLLLVTILLTGNALYGQEVAFARTENNIVIDGSFTDWSETANWYRMRHFVGQDDQSNEDFSAQFSVAFNRAQKELYMAIRVLDDDFVGENGKNHTTQDHMLLYLDAAHDIKGGTPVFYVATDKVLEVHHKPGNFNPKNQFLTLDKAQVARKRFGNTTQYEWKVHMGKYMELNATLGIDFMMIDHDSDNDNETILLWKDGFGKSYGAQKMGDVLLVDPNVQTGKLKGRIAFNKIKEKDRINSIDIVSLENPNLWIKTKVDSTGYFQAILPVGEYTLKPNRLFTSPIYSSGFQQNTRRFDYTNIHPFHIKSNQVTTPVPVEITVRPKPAVTTADSDGLAIEHLTKKEIDNFIGTWKAYYNIPAVSVVVIRKNKVVYDVTIGEKSNFNTEKVDDQTLFEAASITKSVFATMVPQLSERGVIDLDEPLYKYLSFPNIENDERSKLLTARIILGHRSGLPNWAWGGPGIWKDRGNIDLNFEPGTDFGYSGEAFNYLGRVLEKITGKDLQTLFEEEIEKPFGIKKSYFYYMDGQEERFALGHMQQYPQIKEKERVASPASSLSTNAHLFKDFVMTLMNEKGLSKNNFSLIYSPYTPLKPEQKVYDPTIPQHVSHGFFVQNTADGKLIAHGGNNGDYDSKFAYNPDKKYAYIVFTNSNLGDEFIRAFEQFLLR